MTEINELSVALMKAQKAMKAPHKGSVNPFHKSRYADLSAVREATLDALHANELTITQMGAMVDGQFGLKTVLLHTSGQSLEGFYAIPVNPDPQKMGSAFTYAKRYAWSAICAIVAEDDDDGEAAARDRRATAKPEPAKEEPPRTNGNGKPDVLAQTLHWIMNDAHTPEDLIGWRNRNGDRIAKASKPAQDKIWEAYHDRMKAVSQAPHNEAAE